MDIIMLCVKFMTISLAASVAGSTFYISAVEVPARAAMGAPTSPASWLKVFPRAAATMKTIGFILLAAFAVCFVLTWHWLWLVAAVCFFALGPYTGARMAPINNQLQDENLDINSDEAQDLAIEWGKRHLIRTYMSVAGFSIALIAALI